jgi:hypothetical protein
MDVSAYDAACEFIRLSDVLRVFALAHRTPTLAMIEHANEARRRYDQARHPGRHADPDRPVIARPPHRIEYVPMGRGLYRAACGCGKYRTSAVPLSTAHQYGGMHLAAARRRP